MRRYGAIVVYLLSCTVLLETCKGIILTNQESPKPAYTSGIKTTNWRNQNNLQTHQNYSKVYVHNNASNPSQLFLTKAETFERVYPVYNAHSYGPSPEQTQRVVGANSQSQIQQNWTGRGHFATTVGGNLAGSHKNRTIYKRKIEYQTIEVYEKCPEGATGSLVYYLSCNQFLNCWKGRGEVQNCAPGTLFNPKTLECDFPDKVECVTGRQNSLSLPSSRSQKSIVQATCLKDFSGLIPNYTDCSKFISCNNGQQTSMDCPPGTLFDTTQNVCNFPYLTTCFNGRSGDSQNAGGYGSTQSQFGQGQGQYQGQQNGYYQGQGINRGHQYGSQGQGGQTGGQYHQGAYGQTLQGQPCNPQTQDCRYLSNQGQTYSTNQYGQGTYHRNEGQSHQYGHTSTGQQNADSRVDFGANAQQTTHTQLPASQGHRIFTQTTHGTSNCNPQTQNCGQQSGTAYQQVYGQSSGTNCDPQIQNCGQAYGTSHGVNYGQAQAPNCDPRTQNCGQSYNYAQGQSYGQQFTSGCDPSVQNCGQHQGGSQQSYGYSNVQSCDPRTQNCGGNHGYGTTEVYSSTQFQSCDPQRQNCGQGQANTQTTSYGYGQSSGGQQNFHTVCNINDQHCQRNRTTKKNKEPTCPDNFQGITKHPTDCKKFLNCANGRTFIQDCAPGTLFNPAIGNCDFPYNVKCSNDTTEDVTQQYEENTRTDWTNTYNENAQRYGQNAGHGNIREQTTQRYQPSYPTSQEHSQGSHGYGDRAYNQGQGAYQGRPIYNQGHQNQGSYGTGGIRTNQGFYVHRERTGSGYEGTTFQPLTPRPTHVTNIPYESVVNRGQIGLVSRPTYTQVEGTNQRHNAQDYGDVFDPNERKSFVTHSTTPRSAGKWPPPFPTTDVNADYVFEYEDGEPVTLEPENVFYADSKKKKADCGKGDFYCSADMCVSKTAVCDGHRDCQNGKDELDCQEYLKRFTLNKNSQLNILEDQRWINVSQATCALLCIRTTSFECRSFNYRKVDRTCFLSNLNIGLTGQLRQYYPFDYYELKTASIDCTMMFKCKNDKCITSHQVCDGFGDCADREDEKNCKAEDFGYRIKLVGSNKANEGRVEVTAFGKTGYICDDQFGIKDANVICRELGFQLGAAEIKGHSYYATDIKERNTVYMVDDLDCIGNETTLLDCNFPGWGVHNCRNQEIAGLICKTPQEKCGKGAWKCDSGNECVPYNFVCDGLSDCTDDSDEAVQHCEAPTELRLANGTNNREGRVEIKHHGIWGTICDDDFNEDAAKLVCRYFGFRGQAIVKKEAYFGSGDGPIWLDQVSCYGNETELRKCTHWNWGEHNCDHSEDVGVICTNDIEQVQLQRHSKLADSETPRVSSRLLITSCGFRKDNQFLENDLIHARVVAGSVARKGDYPWQAALRIKGKAQKSHHWCGGVIISAQWVLTAAHCLLGYAKGAYMVVAGEYNTDEEEGTEQKKYIEEYFIHDNFTEGERVMKNDIALIKLKGNGFLLNEDVQPVCLPEEEVNYERDLNCTISGFGSVKTGNSAYSHNLMAAWIPIIRTDICNMPHVYDTAMSEGMICAGFLNGGVDSCHGDSGGPLACLDNGLFTVYGITSWGHRCGFANKPGVYVKVAHYRKWVDDTMKNNS